MGNGESGSGSGSGLGSRIRSRQRTADMGTSCPLSAYRFPNLLTIFSNDLNDQPETREPSADSR